MNWTNHSGYTVKSNAWLLLIWRQAKARDWRMVQPEIQCALSPASLFFCLFTRHLPLYKIISVPVVLSLVFPSFQSVPVTWPGIQKTLVSMWREISITRFVFCVVVIYLQLPSVIFAQINRSGRQSSDRRWHTSYGTWS